MSIFEEFQQEVWIEKFREDFNHRFAYGFQDPEDVFASIVTDVLFTKLPTVSLDDKSNPVAFVKAMIRNRTLDYFRRHHKRHQPPTALVRLGEPFPQIFYEHCLGGFSNEVIAEKLSLALEKVNFWVRWLSKEQSCPQTLISVPLDDLEEIPQLADKPAFNPLESRSSVEDVYSQSFIAVLARWLIGDIADPSIDKQENNTVEPNEDQQPDLTQHFQKMLEELDALPVLPVSTDDLLLLKMLYFEEMELREVGKVFGLEDYQVSYKRDKVLQTLELYFKQQGIEFDG